MQSFVFSKQPTQLQRLSEKHPQEIRLRSFSPLLSQACFKAMQNEPPFSHFFALKCPPSFKIPWGQLHRNHFALTAPSRCWLWLGAGAGAGFVPHAGTAQEQPRFPCRLPVRGTFCFIGVFSGEETANLVCNVMLFSPKALFHFFGSYLIITTQLLAVTSRLIVSQGDPTAVWGQLYIYCLYRTCIYAIHTHQLQHLYLTYSTDTSPTAHIQQLHFHSSPLRSSGKQVFMPHDFSQRPFGNTREEICLDGHPPDATLGAALPNY